MLINNLYTDILNIINNPNNFIITTKINQTGGANTETIIQKFIKEELEINNWTYDEEITKYCVLYQLAKLLTIKFIDEKNLGSKLINLLKTQLSGENIISINIDIQQTIIEILINNIIIPTDDVNIKIDISSFETFCIDNDITDYLNKFTFYNYINNHLHKLLNVFKNILFIDELKYNVYRYNINYNLLYTKLIDMLNDENITLKKLLEYNDNLYYIFLTLNFTKDFDIIEDKTSIDKDTYKLFFDEDLQIKFFNLVLYENINLYYDSFNDKIKFEINEFYLNNNSSEQIYDFIEHIITLDDLVYSFESDPFKPDFIKIIQKSFYNETNIYTYFYPKIIKIITKYIDLKDQENVIINDKYIEEENEQIEEYYFWYNKDNSNFDKLTITDRTINDIYEIISNSIPNSISIIDLKLLLLLFQIYNIQIEFLIYKVKFYLFLDMDRLVDPFFYVLESKYKYYFLKSDILFMRQYIPNIVYVHPDPTYIYTYLETHGGIRYFNNISLFNPKLFTKKDYNITINNISLSSYENNKVYLYLMFEQYILNFNNTTPAEDKYIYKNYSKKDFNTYFNLSSSDNFLQNIYNYIYFIINSNFDNKVVNPGFDNNNNYFFDKIKNVNIPLIINAKNNYTLINIINLEDINIKNIINKYIDLNNYENVYIKKYNNVKLLLENFNTEITDNNEKIVNLNTDIDNYVSSIEEKTKLLEDLNIKKDYLINYKLKKEQSINTTIDDKIIEIKIEIDNIKNSNNYDSLINKKNILIEKKNIVESNYNVQITNYNNLIKVLKEYFTEALEQGGDQYTSLTIDDNTEITDELLAELYKLSILKNQTINTNDENDNGILQLYNINDNETPFTKLSDILDFISDGKKEIYELNNDLKTKLIEISEIEYDIKLIDSKIININNELEDLILYNTNISLVEEEIIDCIKLLENYKLLLDQLNETKEQYITSLEQKNTENDKLIEYYNELKTKIIEDDKRELLNFINSKILMDTDNIDIDNFEKDLNEYITNIFDINNNFNYILFYKIVYKFKNVRIILYNDNGELIEYLDRDIDIDRDININRNIERNIEIDRNININNIENSKYFFNIYINIDKKLCINHIDYNNFIKNPARNNKTFYYINDIYVCLDKNNKYLVSQKFNKYNKSLININHNKINIVEQINDDKNIFIKKIIKLFKIPYLIIYDNKESLESFYKFIIYMFFNLNNYTNKTIFKIKVNIILLIMSNYDFNNIQEFLYYFNIPTNKLFSILINNDYKLNNINDFSFFNNIIEPFDINTFNNLLGDYYTTNDIDGDYRYIIESHFRSENGLEEIKNSNKLKDFYIYNKNNEIIKSNELLIQLSTEIIYMNLFDDYFVNNILFIYPLSEIKLYYDKYVFNKPNLINLPEDVKNGLIRAEYYQIIKILQLCKIDFIGDINNCINEYFNLIDELYESYNSFNNIQNYIELYRYTGAKYLNKIKIAL